MNAEALLAQYERIAEAPDAIARLRRFVLDLAVRGKLVPQDSSEEPAAALLKRIEHTKARRLKAGEIRKADAAVETAQPPAGMGLPRQWVATTLQTVCETITDGDHLPPPKSDEGVPFLVIGNVRHQRVDFTDTRFVPQAYYDALDTSRRPRQGDLLYTLVGSFGIPVIVTDDRPFCVQRHIGILRPCAEISVSYLARVMESSLLLVQAHACATGIAQKTVPLSGLRKFALPLPPLAEQHRIVSKVDELMALCDRLEAARTAREATRDRLAAASLARLNTPDPKTFPSDARFALAALPALTTRPDQIKQLRQTILHLAVRGKLVPQTPSHEPATKLLDRIRLERNALLQRGYPNATEARAQEKKQVEQQLPPQLAMLPDGWVWATLMQCSALVVDCKNKTAPYANSGIKLVRTTNVRDGRLNSTDQKYVDQGTYEIWSARCVPQPGDILITREAPMGEVCLVPAGEQICLGQRMMLARLVPGTISAEFMIYSLRDPYLLDRVQDKPIGATVQHLRVGGVETLLIPLPPLAEQRRIVAKVDELMALCDALEASLAAATDTRTRLLDATLRDALASDTQHFAEAAE